MKTETPILFQADMIRAILSGTKTQTRRIVKGQCKHCIIEEYDGKQMICRHCEHGSGYIKCRYDADELWVKETFAIESNENLQDVYTKPRNPLGPVIWNKDVYGSDFFVCPRYRANEPETILGDDESGMKWKPSRFMPRWASRIQLAVKKIRVERVQDITPFDCLAEGMSATLNEIGLRYAYGQLWNQINEKRGFSWDSNPFVFVIEFERIKP
jgi:hypothetical protein